MKIVTKITLASLSVMMLVLVGCGGEENVVDKKPMATQTADKSNQPAVASPSDADSSMANKMPTDPLTDPNNILAQRIVYFDYDSSSVREDSLQLIKAHAEYLSQNTSLAFTLEGHADERGTREYNIALGEQRADSVRRLLVANGVASNQIKVVSYGEERPAQLGHAETVWSANRRAVFSY